MRHPPLVLASASPRRTGILTGLGLAHEVCPAEIDERYRDGESPAEHAERLAREKALVVAGQRPEALVVAGDTVVVVEGDVLGKPAGSDDARQMLARLAGREHLVHSGLAVRVPDGTLRSRVETVRVRFRPLDDRAIDRYVATGEPLDKAGAYGIQGRGAALVEAIVGDYYAVVGMPVAGLVTLLEEVGWRYGFDGLDPL